MSDIFGLTDRSKFAPQPGDSVRELRWKAESRLEVLRDIEPLLRQFPVGALDERIALWQSLAKLLAHAMEFDALADDARLEAHRVWAEETRHTAIIVVTMCEYSRSPVAELRFKDTPDLLDQLVEQFELNRHWALSILSTEDRDFLRGGGFLRQGE